MLCLIKYWWELKKKKKKYGKVFIKIFYEVIVYLLIIKGNKIYFVGVIKCIFELK